MAWLDATLQANHVVMREALWPPGDTIDAYHDGLNPPSAYRQLSQITQSNRSLTPVDQDRQIDIAAQLSTSTPLGQAIIELLVDYTIGEGFNYKCSDILKPVLDAHWTHWVNRWPEKQFDRFRELYRFGEAAWPLFVRRDGRVLLGYIDPANIKAVQPDPYNIEILEWLILKPRHGADGIVDEQRFRIPYKDETEGSRSENRWIVEPARANDRTANGVFYTPINNFLNSTRGKSDLYACFDALDMYDSFCFGAAERGLSLTDFIWDVKTIGMSLAQQQEWLRLNPMPTGRAMRVHNENVEWKAVSPELHALDVSEQARLLRMQATLPHRIPEGWLFAGSETNRSTLAEQSAPTMKYLSRRQRQVKAILQRLLEFVRDQAILAGKLPSTLSPEDEEITVEASEVSVVDLSQMAVTFKDTMAALVVAEDRGYLTHDEAAGVARRVAHEYGTDLPAELPPGAAPLPAEQVMDQGVPPQALNAMVQSAQVTQATRRLRQQLAGVGANGQQAERG